jgi:hypothetical protein
VRRGFDLSRQPETLASSDDGSYLIETEELGRIELSVSATTGYSLMNGKRGPLPAGSTMRGGTFFWQLGLAFLGDFPFVFERADGTEVRVNMRVRPKTYFH